MEEDDGGKKMDAAVAVCGSRSSSPSEERTATRTEEQAASRTDLMVVGVGGWRCFNRMMDVVGARSAGWSVMMLRAALDYACAACCFFGKKRRETNKLWREERDDTDSYICEILK